MRVESRSAWWRNSGWLLVLALVGCGEKEPEPEPLKLPDDPAAQGVPVGVTEIEHEGLPVAIWYPASDATSGKTEGVDFVDFIPDSVLGILGTVEVPVIETIAVRDADLRVPESPYPVVVFSHGFGGIRYQSVDITAHLASRGYVVVATDHEGRALGDLLPCIFNPPAEGCSLAGFGDDPAVADVDALVRYIDGAAKRGFLAGAIDPDALGIFGHSAGGGSTSAVLNANDRFVAGIPMAGAGVIERDVPSLIMAGDCDAVVTYDQLTAAHAGSANTGLLTVEGGGHHAFSDICTVDLQGLYDDYLVGREDVNDTIADMLLSLGTDGCPGYAPPIDSCGDAWLPLDVSMPIVRHYTTAFFDEHLYGTGSGIAPGVFPEATLIP